MKFSEHRIKFECDVFFMWNLGTKKEHNNV